MLFFSCVSYILLAIVYLNTTLFAHGQKYSYNFVNKRNAQTTFSLFFVFLVACTRLYNLLCPSVGRLVGRSVGHTLLFFMILFL